MALPRMSLAWAEDRKAFYRPCRGHAHRPTLYCSDDGADAVAGLLRQWLGASVSQSAAIYPTNDSATDWAAADRAASEPRAIGL